jgi:molybdate-binding protein/DNA-binding XRE family transcriptional regulator
MTRGSEIRGKAANRADRQNDIVATTNRLHKMRQARGLGAAEIARRAGVSRQTIYAIESGDFVPNTAVALQLARILEVSVEELFSIDTSPDQPLASFKADLLATGGRKCSAGELVRVGRVGTRMVAAPAPHFATFLSDADGVIAAQSKTSGTIRPVVQSVSNRNSLVVAGCDPAISVLAGELKSAGTEVVTVPSSSQEALDWLKRGLVHVAGTHLRDRLTGEYNVPLATTLFGKGNICIVTFAEWEQGLVVRRGNPKRIRSVADLAGKRVTIVNREKGSGARDLLDSKMRAAGIPPRNIRGYDRVVPTHLAAALTVANAQADCCVATVSAAKCLGLDFIPLSTERFDLVVASSEMDNSGIRALFDALNRANLRHKLAMVAGYDVRHTGDTLM